MSKVKYNLTDPSYFVIKLTCLPSIFIIIILKKSLYESNVGYQIWIVMFEHIVLL